MCCYLTFAPAREQIKITHFNLFKILFFLNSFLLVQFKNKTTILFNACFLYTHNPINHFTKEPRQNFKTQLDQRQRLPLRKFTKNRRRIKFQKFCFLRFLKLKYALRKKTVLTKSNFYHFTQPVVKRMFQA